MNDQEKEKLYDARWAVKKIWDTDATETTKGLASDAYDAITSLIGDRRKIDGTFSNPVDDHTGDHTHQPFKYTPPTVVNTGIAMPMSAGFLTSSGKAKGLVIHTTEGHLGGKDQALNVLSYLASQGYGCLVMDENGIIYTGKLGVNARGAHAGRGKWNGVDNANATFFGIEVCSPGQIQKRGDGKYYYDWGSPIPSELIPRIRYGGSEYGTPGYYMAMSEAQETALLNFCLWQKATNPEFKIENVCGHYEWAPGRKSDPGASLSMTMIDFRKKLLELLV